MIEKIREYLRRPDRVNLNIFFFSFAAYFLSWQIADSEKLLIYFMLVFMAFGALFFVFFLSGYTVTIFLSSMALLYLINRSPTFLTVIFAATALIINPFAMFSYLRERKYIGTSYSVNLIDFLKMFIFSNMVPAFIAIFVASQIGSIHHLVFLTASFILIANFYFWHQLVNSQKPS